MSKNMFSHFFKMTNWTPHPPTHFQSFLDFFYVLGISYVSVLASGHIEF